MKQEKVAYCWTNFSFLLEATAGFEPATNKGFAVPALSPLGHVALEGKTSYHIARCIDT